MVTSKRLLFNQTNRLEATRRAIQHEFLHQLTKSGFTFSQNEKEPRGIQASVLKAVNEIYHGRSKLQTNRQQVSDWVARVRRNNYRVTAITQDYSKSSQNRRKVFKDEQRLIRQQVRDNDLKCGDLKAVHSTTLNRRITLSESTVRRYLKRPFEDEPSMVAAKPKGFKVGGNTAHHNKCRRLEAEFWNRCTQEEINGIWFADETKITFRAHPNKQIDIKWVLRGQASEANWYEEPKHPGQINLFLCQSIDGIEMFDIYKNNMKLDRFKELIPQIKAEVRKSNAPFTFFMHDNA